MVSQSIANITMRVLVNTQHTEYHDGRRTNVLQLREWPITGGPADSNTKPQVFLDGTSQFAASSELDSDEIEIHEKATTIIRLGGNWSNGRRNIKVIYDAGEGVGGTSADMPSDLEDAALQYVGWMYRLNNDRRIGVESKTKLGETVRYSPGIPKFIELLIEPYLRTEFPVSETITKNS